MLERPPHVAGPLGAAAAETTTQKDENQTENFDSFDDLNLCTVIFERILVILQIFTFQKNNVRL